jgi:hypothetical protein
VTEKQAPNTPKRENTWLSLGLNILLPALILMKGAQWFGLPPAAILVIALAFPIGYGCYDFVIRRKYNVFSIIGFVSILLTGGIGLLELSPRWIAVKEAGIPALLGVAVIVSLKTRYPIINFLLLRDEFIDVDRLNRELEARNNRRAFDKLLGRCTYLLAFSFLVSAILNYVLARMIVVSPSGTEAFNDELGRMTLWSMLVIVVPCMIIMMVALFYLFRGIKDLTGLELEVLLRDPQKRGA